MSDQNNLQSLESYYEIKLMRCKLMRLTLLALNEEIITLNKASEIMGWPLEYTREWVNRMKREDKHQMKMDISVPPPPINQGDKNEL